MPSVANALPIVVLMLLAYLVYLRPARKRAQEVSAMQQSLSAGDDVMLTSGIFGRVQSVLGDDDATVTVEISPGVVVTVHRGAIGRIVHAEVAQTASPADEPGHSAAGASVDDGHDPERDRDGGVV